MKTLKMKTLKMFVMTLLAIVIGVSLTSCSKYLNNTSHKFSISLSCVGEILDISHESLTKSSNATSNNIYSITIYTEDNGYIYATGTFNNLDDLKVDLLDGKTYSFKASYVINSSIDASNQFDYTVMPSNNIVGDLLRERIYSSYDVYYGTIAGYTPQVNDSVEIYMKRMSFGFKLIANSLNDGASIKAALTNEVHSTPAYTTLTYSLSECDKIYSFDKSIWDNVYKGVLIDTEYVNYSETAKLEIILKRIDGIEVNLGKYDILLERNKKTIVNINIGEIDSSMSNGIVITQEKEEMSDGKQYDINGSEGTIIETPIVTE